MRSIKFPLSLPVVCMLLLSSLFLGACGPSAEQIRAMEEKRVRAEEARAREAEERRVAEEARQARLLSAIGKADLAAANKDFDNAFRNYATALEYVQRYDKDDIRIREKMAGLAASMPAPPQPGDEALRFMVRGQAKVKMGGTGSYEAAMEEMEKALMAAPWWADGYFNLGLIQEKAASYAEALQNLKLYLLAAPQSPDAKAVQMKIYEIEVAQEEAKKTQALGGVWRNKESRTRYDVSLEGGRKMTIREQGSDGYSIKVDKNGQGLEGFITIPGRRSNYCNLPGETNPVSGTIAVDGLSMELRFQESRYKTSNRFVGLSMGGWECTGVSLLNKDDSTLRLVKDPTSEEEKRSGRKGPKK